MPGRPLSRSSSPSSLSPSDMTLPEPLTILIAGAGIGGLVAATGLRSHGHQVHVFEQSRMANEVGAAIHMAPNCNRILRSLGLKLEEGHGAVDCTGITMFGPDARVILDNWRPRPEEQFGAPYHLMHRAHLHSAIKQKALEAGVEIHTSSKVTGIDPEKGELYLEDGVTWTGDVLVGADGINSRMRASIPGAENIKPFGTGRSGFRFLIPMSSVTEHPEASKLILRPGNCIRFQMSEDRLLIGYPCVNNTLMNCFGICPTEVATAKLKNSHANGNAIPTSPPASASASASAPTSTDTTASTANPPPAPTSPTLPATPTSPTSPTLPTSPTSPRTALANKAWSNTASKQQMLGIFRDAHPAVRAFFDAADEAGGVRLWEIMDMDALPAWTHARLALLGDAAHPFTPWRGQGGAMAIEDAASLAAVLPAGTPRRDVPARLRLYFDVRRERATLVQAVSRRSGGPIHTQMKNMAGLKGFDNAAFEQMLHTHDELQNTQKALAELQARS